MGVQDRNRVIHTLPLVVVPGTEPSLLGRNWLTKVHVDWIAVHACRPTEHNSALNQTLRKHPVLFKDSKEIAKTDMRSVSLMNLPHGTSSPETYLI